MVHKPTDPKTRPQDISPQHRPCSIASVLTPTSLPFQALTSLPHSNQTLSFFPYRCHPDRLRFDLEDGQTRILFPFLTQSRLLRGDSGTELRTLPGMAQLHTRHFRFVPSEPRNSCISSRWISTSGASDARSGTISPSGSFAKSWERVGGFLWFLGFFPAPHLQNDANRPQSDAKLHLAKMSAPNAAPYTPPAHPRCKKCTDGGKDSPQLDTERRETKTPTLILLPRKKPAAFRGFKRKREKSLHFGGRL